MSSDFISVINVNQLAEDAIKQVTVVGRSILLIKHTDKVYAIISRCPHMGCSLAMGKLKEYIITCPCHGWSFDIRNGEYQDNKAIKLTTFECKVEDGEVLVKPFDDF